MTGVWVPCALTCLGVCEEWEGDEECMAYLELTINMSELWHIREDVNGEYRRMVSMELLFEVLELKAMIKRQ